jgi:hypothetical protein
MLLNIASDRKKDGIARIQSFQINTSSAKNGDSAHNHTPLESAQLQKQEEGAEAEREEQYMATSPGGTKLQIPKELFVALSDFMKTRKCPGSITIQFRRGEIVCVEAVAKKTYLNH